MNEPRPTLLAALAVLVFLGPGCSPAPVPMDPAPQTPPPVATTPAVPTSRPPSSPRPTEPPPPSGVVIRVSGPHSLRTALAAAEPGQTIVLADGAYSGRPARGNDGSEPGRYVIDRSGTEEQPITLQGSRSAVLDGDGTGGGYVLHLVNASHWRLVGFTAASGSKGIVLDRSSHNLLDGLRVTDIGDEGVHFRDSSSDNILRNSDIDLTGQDSEGFGEGVYLGSAVSNWERYSGGRPDRSDRNQVLDNRIIDTRVENIDIKEGTTGGIIRGNTLGGNALAGQNSADSWIDVKGSGYLIEGNHGQHTPAAIDADACARGKKATFCNGFEVHTPIEGAGADNIFRANRLEVNAPGAGIWLQNDAVERGNVLSCSNQIVGAAAGEYATNHYSELPCIP